MAIEKNIPPSEYISIPHNLANKDSEQFVNDVPTENIRDNFQRLWLMAQQ